MSEIKGQLLGVILTISIFGIVATTMATSFKKAGESIGSKVENAANTTVTAAAAAEPVSPANAAYYLVY